MSYTLQIHGERRVYPIPNGLYELMSDIAREVLRDQPNDVHSYIADYIDTLIKTKCLAEVAVKTVDDVLAGEDPCIALCASLGVSLEAANRAAAIIQAAFLGYMARKRLQKPATDLVKTSDITHMTVDKFLEDHKISFLQASQAAVKIQAAWRGYIVRKHLRSETEHATATDTYAMESWNHDWLWKEFETKPESKEYIFQKELLVPKRGMEKSKYLPRRSITIDHHKLKTLFHGEKEDYEQLEGLVTVSESKESVEPSHQSEEKEESEDNYVPVDYVTSEAEDQIQIAPKKPARRVSLADSRGIPLPPEEPESKELEEPEELGEPEEPEVFEEVEAEEIPRSKTQSPEALPISPVEIAPQEEPTVENIMPEIPDSITQTDEDEYNEEDYSEFPIVDSEMVDDENV